MSKVGTSTDAVEGFIQSVLKEAVLSEGMLRTRDDTKNAYATVDLLRALTAERDALQAQLNGQCNEALFCECGMTGPCMWEQCKSPLKPSPTP